MSFPQVRFIARRDLHGLRNSSPLHGHPDLCRGQSDSRPTVPQVTARLIAALGSDRSWLRIAARCLASPVWVGSSVVQVSAAVRHDRLAARWLATLQERAVAREVRRRGPVDWRKSSQRVHWDETSELRQVTYRAIAPRRLATLLDGS